MKKEDHAIVYYDIPFLLILYMCMYVHRKSLERSILTWYQWLYMYEQNNRQFSHFVFLSESLIFVVVL